jgi:beta-lactam-binding protein with PASTA domain
VKIVLLRPRHGRVPDVVGLPLETARRKLLRRDLASLVDYADGRREGVVLAQFPQAGRAAVRNMTVRLVVARS